MRAACDVAVRGLLESEPELIVIAGAAGAIGTGEWGPAAGGTLASYGVDVRAGGAEPVLPVSLTIGGWLLDRAEGRPTPSAGGSAAVVRAYLAVAADATPDECAEMGRGLVTRAARVGLLVMGDGSARRSATAPGSHDPRAGEYDARVSDALTRPDPAALLALDAELDRELWAAGRPAWQMLAGAALATYTARPGTRIDTTLHYDQAPLGVGYHVVEWTIRAGAVT